MLATASIIAVVFLIVFIVVKTAVYQELDNDLDYEGYKHTKEIQLVEGNVVFVNKKEWEEREHREVQVNPVFIQIVDKQGRTMDKSPNLKKGELTFHSEREIGTHFDEKLAEEAIRQVQIPIQHNGVLKGYILTAMSQEAAISVIRSLKNTLLLLFPLVLLVLFFITRLLAGRSIRPIRTITNTADRITKNNLNERIQLPPNRDELHALTSSINELLDRIQNTVEREKQFTADASHQLRTPLAVLKGTMEVLVRKPRTEQEYKEKITYSIGEIDRISEIVEQLLTLARFDKNNQKIAPEKVHFQSMIDAILQRFTDVILDKEFQFNLNIDPESSIYATPYYVDLILENIISNALKYSPQKSEIGISVISQVETVTCQIKDKGIGIKKEDIGSIFHPFFRSDELNHKDIKGNGLGLSIVEKAAQLINAQVTVHSEMDKGSTFTITFPKNANL